LSDSNVLGELEKENEDDKYKERFFNFITQEQKTLKEEINQIKQGQITLLTGTVSAIALFFTFLFAFFNTTYKLSGSNGAVKDQVIQVLNKSDISLVNINKLCLKINESISYSNISENITNDLKGIIISITDSEQQLSKIIDLQQSYLENGNGLLEGLDAQLGELIILLPLLILIPSAFIFFHKSYEVNEKTAFIQILNKKILNEEIFHNYEGYENYKPDFDIQFHSTASSKYFEGIIRGLDHILTGKRGNRFWTMSFYAYMGLIVIILSSMIYPIICSKSLENIDLIVYIAFIVALVFTFPYLLGKAFGKSRDYWKKFGVNVYNILFIWFPSIIFISSILIPLLYLYVPNFISWLIRIPLAKDYSIYLDVFYYYFGFLIAFGTILVIYLAFSKYYERKFDDENSDGENNDDVKPKWYLFVYEEKESLASTIIYAIIIVLLGLVIYFGLDNSNLQNIKGVICYIAIILSYSTILLCFFKIWNLRYGNKSIDVLNTTWIGFIEEVSNQKSSHNKAEINKDLVKDQNILNKSEQIDVKELIEKFNEENKD